ncbi:hypothetical protein [Brevibacterium sp. Marseille-P9724]|uniref:hypothetical protein n=1 Tax=Brevibacterium sp. Marseille-P9724 TaxID=2614125 RepID=UPI00125EBA30|nr:hypothetical protein [Brevibacterium sp. Marseille-P9724]
MTSADNGDKTIYLNGSNVRYMPVQDIIELYETPEGRANSLMTLDELLMKSLGRNDVSDRIKLANYFLDKGADPSYVESSDGVNCLHVLLYPREHDYEREAPLLDESANINQRGGKFGYPMEVAFYLSSLGGDPNFFYDEVFSRPGIDFGVVINRHSGAILADMYLGMPSAESGLPKRTEDYIAQHGLHGDGKPPFVYPPASQRVGKD